MSQQAPEIRPLEDVSDAEHNHALALDTIRKATADAAILKAAAIADHAMGHMSRTVRERQEYARSESAREDREERRQRKELAKLKAAETARAETAATAIRALSKLLPKAIAES